MKTLFAVCVLSLVAVSLFGQAPVVEQSATISQASRKDFVSEASYVVGTYQPASGDHSPQAMAEAANKFLASLDADQRKRAVYELQSPERRDWTNLPPRPGAGGIRLGDLKVEQVKAACDLIAALLSPEGYRKVCNVMLADDQLLSGGQARQGFGTEQFSIVVFGTPSDTQPWAFQLDGHHLGLNVSLTGEKLTLSPSFIGSQPEAFKLAGVEYRPLAGETDLAYLLMKGLSDEQKKQAILRPRRAQLVTGPGADGVVPQPKGVSCATFSDEQKKTLIALISQWIDIYPAKQAKAHLEQITSELDKMSFSWNGPGADRADVSYTIQSPSLIIEFACQDLGGNPLNHLHTMYREPANEYAGQLTK
jgi:hypothetical protein